MFRKAVVLMAMVGIFVVASCTEAAPVETTEASSEVPVTITPVVTQETPQTTTEDEEIILSEDELIEAALIQQGYYRDDIPLSFLEQDYLHTAADEFGIDYYILVALIDRETDFRNIAGDGGRSYGYCQIQPRWWSGLMAEIGAEDLNDPYDNFRTAAAILARHLERYGTMENALTCYNRGKPGKSEYATDILATAEKWREG